MRGNKKILPKDTTCTTASSSSLCFCCWTQRRSCSSSRRTMYIQTYFILREMRKKSVFQQVGSVSLEQRARRRLELAFFAQASTIGLFCRSSRIATKRKVTFYSEGTLAEPEPVSASVHRRSVLLLRVEALLAPLARLPLDDGRLALSARCGRVILRGLRNPGSSGP